MTDHNKKLEFLVFLWVVSVLLHHDKWQLCSIIEISRGLVLYSVIEEEKS